MHFTGRPGRAGQLRHPVGGGQRPLRRRQHFGDAARLRPDREPERGPSRLALSAHEFFRLSRRADAP